MDLSAISIPEDLAPQQMVTCTIDGILEEDDLRELALVGELAEVEPEAAAELDDPSDLKRVREKHHSVARLVAGGLSQRMVSMICGYQESYLSILLNNPAMMELVEMYRIQNGAAIQVITEKLRSVGLKAVDRLEDKLDDMNATELTAVAKLGLDRGGHGPASKQHIVAETHIIDHAEISRRNDEARKRSATRIVPVSDVRAALEYRPTDDEILPEDDAA